MNSPLMASLGALFLLAGCSGQSQSQSEAKTTPTKTATDEKVLPDTGGGEPIELTAIGKGELPRLDGERACNFTIKGQSGPAFVAKANVGADQSVFGAYKIGDKVQRVVGAGGFEALEKGMEMSGPGMKLTIERVAKTAKLTATRTYGGERSFEGEWTCGA